MIRNSKDRTGLLILAGILVVLALLGMMAWLQIRQRGMIDEYTLCLKGRPPAERTIVLIDKTDPMSDKQVRELVSKIRHIKDVELKTNGMLSIFLVGDSDGGYLSRAFCLCNPGHEANQLVEDPGRVQARFDSLFGQPLEAALDILVKSETSPQSPLLEAVRQVSQLEEFSPDAPRRLIIVSDMLQNTDGFSLYRNRPTFAHLKDSAYYEQVRTDLSGVAVQEIRILRRRDQALATAELDQFWRSFFMDCGAKVLPGSML